MRPVLITMKGDCDDGHQLAFGARVSEQHRRACHAAFRAACGIYVNHRGATEGHNRTRPRRVRDSVRRTLRQRSRRRPVLLRRARRCAGPHGAGSYSRVVPHRFDPSRGPRSLHQGSEPPAARLLLAEVAPFPARCRSSHPTATHPNSRALFRRVPGRPRESQG